MGSEMCIRDRFYDYRAAFREGAKPGPDGHWPSKFKMPGHPNEVVAGFNTRTGDRVPGTKRGTRDEMIGLGWEPDTATRLIGMDDLRHSPDMRRVATRRYHVIDCSDSGNSVDAIHIRWTRATACGSA